MKGNQTGRSEYQLLLRAFEKEGQGRGNCQLHVGTFGSQLSVLLVDPGIGIYSIDNDFIWQQSMVFG